MTRTGNRVDISGSEEVLSFPLWPLEPVASTVDLTRVLAALTHQVDRRELPIQLRPGRSPENVAAEFERRDLNPHPDVVTLWSWHDGAELYAYRSGHFSLNHYFYPLDEAFQMWDFWREEEEWVDGDYSGVPRQYIAFLALGAGTNSYAVNVESGEVVLQTAYSGEDDWLRWPNMATFFNDLVDALAQGYEWPDDTPGIHTPDPDLYPEFTDPR